MRHFHLVLFIVILLQPAHGRLTRTLIHDRHSFVKNRTLQVPRGGIANNNNAFPPSRLTSGPQNPVAQGKRGTGAAGGQSVRLFEDTSFSSSTAVNAFLSADSRRHFITRVYMTLALQLLTTTAFVVAAALNHSKLVPFMLSDNGPLTQFVAACVSLGTFYALMMSPEVRRGPHKYKFLAAFTVSESVLVALITSMFPGDMVAKAAMTTTTAALGATGYAVLNKNPARDLTAVGSGVFGFGLAFVGYQLLALTFRALGVPFLRLPWNELLGCSIGAGLSTFYIAYHTSLIVGGKHKKYQMDAEDHIYGAMALFSDIINLFIYILRILAESNKDKR